MTTPTSGAQFEIKVDGVARTSLDVRETAIEVAPFPAAASGEGRRGKRNAKKRPRGSLISAASDVLPAKPHQADDANVGVSRRSRQSSATYRGRPFSERSSVSGTHFQSGVAAPQIVDAEGLTRAFPAQAA